LVKALFSCRWWSHTVVVLATQEAETGG
jgi:hypothetical protein